MMVTTYNALTLAVKERNGYGCDGCVLLAEVQQLDCNFVALQQGDMSKVKRRIMRPDIVSTVPGSNFEQPSKGFMKWVWQSRNSYMP